QWCRFFFQAEDGIRDWSVTGVQTCALPICRQPLPAPLDGGDYELLPLERHEAAQLLAATLQGAAPAAAEEALEDLLDAVDGHPRSEERRVGKEGRARAWREDEEQRTEASRC